MPLEKVWKVIQNLRKRLTFQCLFTKFQPENSAFPVFKLSPSQVEEGGRRMAAREWGAAAELLGRAAAVRRVVGAPSLALALALLACLVEGGQAEEAAALLATVLEEALGRHYLAPLRHTGLLLTGRGTAGHLATQPCHTDPGTRTLLEMVERDKLLQSGL